MALFITPQSESLKHFMVSEPGSSELGSFFCWSSELTPMSFEAKKKAYCPACCPTLQEEGVFIHGVQKLFLVDLHSLWLRPWRRKVLGSKGYGVALLTSPANQIQVLLIHCPRRKVKAFNLYLVWRVQSWRKVGSLTWWVQEDGPWRKEMLGSTPIAHIPALYHGDSRNKQVPWL